MPAIRPAHALGISTCTEYAPSRVLTVAGLMECRIGWLCYQSDASSSSSADERPSFDDEGEVLNLIVQGTRHVCGAQRPQAPPTKNQPFETQTITTDGLRSGPPRLHDLRLLHRHIPGRLQDNNRGETCIRQSSDESGHAALQVSRLCTALSDRPRNDLQYVLPSPPSQLTACTPRQDRRTAEERPPASRHGSPARLSLLYTYA